MNRFLPVVAALVAGVALGAWQPRGDLLALRAEVDTLRAESRKPCRSGGASAISEIFRANSPEAPKAPPQGAAPEALEAPTVPAPSDAPPSGPRPDSEASVAAMRATLDARRAQALQALREQADLSDEQLDSVDEVMDDMNARLKSEVDKMVADVAAAGEIDRRDMLEFGAEVLDIVLVADDAMRELVPDSAELDDALIDPFSYISGDTVASAAKLQDLPGFDE